MVDAIPTPHEASLVQRAADHGTLLTRQLLAFARNLPASGSV